MALRLTTKVCHCCNRGIPQNAQKTVLWNARTSGGALEMVNRWTCPACQSIQVLIELAGRPITAARYAVLQTIA